VIGYTAWAFVAIALAGPTLAARRSRPGLALASGLLPAAALFCALRLSLLTDWADRRAPGSDDFTNGASLLVLAAVVLAAGLLGLVIAGAERLVARLRRAPRE
jgi:hypothetical protein